MPYYEDARFVTPEPRGFECRDLPNSGGSELTNMLSFWLRYVTKNR